MNDDYKKIAREQHRLLMKIMEYGCADKKRNKDLSEYAKRVLSDKTLLKLID